VIAIAAGAGGTETRTKRARMGARRTRRGGVVPGPAAAMGPEGVAVLTVAVEVEGITIPAVPEVPAAGEARERRIVQEVLAAGEARGRRIVPEVLAIGEVRERRIVLVAPATGSREKRIVLVVPITSARERMHKTTRRVVSRMKSPILLCHSECPGCRISRPNMREIN